ncbi:sialate O-acetylesterase [Spirosoma soli]|uniref:Sialate O-acetylesterase n=1 Tax=Spirosoma soli TaxID=1770529 RepID=A0ABW5MAM0_9BACT
MLTRLSWLLLLVSLPFYALAQLQISHPMSRLVVQRGADGNGRLYVSGRFNGNVDRVEAQLTAVASGQGISTDWQTVQTNPTNNLFLGYVTAAGGWYVLTVRTVVGNIVTAQASVQPVGIGEVFVTAGQSNSRGLGIADNDLGTATDRVNAIDSINHGYYGGNVLISSGDPSPLPVYKPLTAGRRIFPMAESSWAWGELGDYIVNRYNVPVAFYVAGWDGSTIENWYNSANGIPTCNRYNCSAGNWPNLQPYTNLKNIMNYYLSMAGVRAVLWQQGEAEYDFDSQNTSVPQYPGRLTGVIQKSRQDFGGRNIPWVVARASFDGSVTRQGVIDAQNQVINTVGNVFPGPANDNFTNRNAGKNDVHFGNVSRPTQHPRYYLNPASIPLEMGLSRLANSWNNSLDNNFFQNAQPITPTQFAVTGTIADYVLVGSTLNVSFAALGNFAGDNQWQVQLLDSLGKFQAVLGNGPASPIQVTLPGSYQSGRFRIRVVATSPGLPAVPSNLFRITTQPPPTDLSLTMGVNQRSPNVNESVAITLVVRNEGPNPATNVVVQNRLPDNLAFVSASGMTANGGVVTGTIPNLGAGATTTLSFVAQPTTPGTYRNTAEIAQASPGDPDSQPNSGTGDGQDDAAGLDFRTRQQSGAVFTSPNPNQVPLPAVSSNQPTPDPAKADMSLKLSVSNRAPALNEVITYSVTLSNLGGATATGLNVIARLSAGQQFVAGDDFTPINGTDIIGATGSVAAGSSVTIRFRALAISGGQGTCAAQLISASPQDPDSSPNNGFDNGEDDTSRTDIRVR